MHKVLFVDDDEDELFLFQKGIENIGAEFSITHANSCERMNDVLEIFTPDIIFLDINMPGKNGIECLKSLRAEKRYDKVPVIIYSTSNSPKNISESFDAGANSYIIKPDTIEKIVASLNKLFSSNWKAPVYPPIDRFVIRPEL